MDGKVLTGIHGNRLGLTNGAYLAGAGLKGLLIGDREGATNIVSTPQKVRTLFDDFLGDVLTDTWSGAKGTDAQAVVPTINAQAGGVVRLVSGDTVVAAESVSSLTHGLNWQPSLGKIIFEARIKVLSAVTNAGVFVGLTDALATGTLEEPISLITSTWATNATDAVGFVLGSTGSTGQMRFRSVANDVDISTSIVSDIMAADTWYVVRLEVGTDGTVTPYLDGVRYADIVGAVTTTVALTPCVSVMTRTTASQTVDVDYISVQQIVA